MERLLATFGCVGQDGLMYLMYVDESGDSGLHGSPTRYFVLSGIVVHELRWHEALNRLVSFRQRMRTRFGLQMREEIHAGPMLSRPGKLLRIRKNDRLTIIRAHLDELASMKFLNVINVRVDKEGKPADYDPFERAWEALIQRFENTLRYSNFPRPKFIFGDIGIIFCDAADEASLRRIYRRMRVFNPIPNMRSFFTGGYRQLPLTRVAEDPNIRHSHHSYFIQAADTAAFALYQHYAPSAYVRKKGARNYFLRLDPILCKVASRTPLGVVEL
jgi:Protein of unknown function (DUF3800)